MKKTFSFYLKLLALNVLVFVSHLIILNWFDVPLFSNKIIESYFINMFMAALLYLLIDKYKHKFKDNIGSIFLLNSFLKFILFAVFIYPFYKLDGVSTKLEFSTFFIPYVTCLIFETVALIKMLNKLDYKN